VSGAASSACLAALSSRWRSDPVYNVPAGDPAADGLSDVAGPAWAKTGPVKTMRLRTIATTRRGKVFPDDPTSGGAEPQARLAIGLDTANRSSYETETTQGGIRERGYCFGLFPKVAQVASDGIKGVNGVLDPSGIEVGDGSPPSAMTLNRNLDQPSTHAGECRTARAGSPSASWDAGRVPFRAAAAADERQRGVPDPE